MAAYVLSTNLYTFAQLKNGFLAWPADTGEGEIIRGLGQGDLIVPKFAQSPTYRGDSGQDEAQRRYCESIGIDYDAVRREYESEMNRGRSVPCVIEVVQRLPDDTRQIPPWSQVEVVIEPFDVPLPTVEFLRLRGLPSEIAAQFKATVAQGRHLQEVSSEFVDQIRSASQQLDRGDSLRRYSLVQAASAEEAAQLLAASGRTVRRGDQVFVVSPGGLLGLHNAEDGRLTRLGRAVESSPDELIEVFEDANGKARDNDYFAPQRAFAALREMNELMAGPEQVQIVDDFGRFYDRYVLLERKITQALEISARPATPYEAEVPGSDLVPPEVEDTETELDEAVALHGLTVEAVKAQLSENIELPDSVLAEAVTALRSGKHLLIGGPPGTGKSTLAEALSRAVVGNQYDVATATADWTTFDTIGGYVPSDEGLRFEPGIVLRALTRGAWVVIDELNRADIDKAFGPLFTLLAGTGGEQPNRRVVLPYRRSGRSIEVRWAQTRQAAEADFVVTPTWRLIGTLNLADKASLFQLSFAFLRRFAVLNVPLPEPDRYRILISNLMSVLQHDVRDVIADCSLQLAYGPRQIGPAIMKDIAMFLIHGVVATATSTGAYQDPVQAFLTAIRLYVVPQYEGATADEIAVAFNIVRGCFPNRPIEDFAALRDALQQVALS